MAIILTSCSTSNLITSNINESKINAIIDISMHSEKEEYPQSVEEILLIIENNTNGEVTFGEYFTAQIFKDSLWKTIPFTTKGDEFIEISNVISHNSSVNHKINLKRLDYKIQTGKYRIIIKLYKNTGEEELVAAEFTVR